MAAGCLRFYHSMSLVDNLPRHWMYHIPGLSTPVTQEEIQRLELKFSYCCFDINRPIESIESNS